MNARAILLVVVGLSFIGCGGTPEDDVDVALERAGLSSLQVDWDSRDEALHLNGTVPTDDVRQEAEAVATSALAGQGRVVNDINVTGQEVPLDAEDGDIRAELDRLIERDQTLREREIDVHVINGTVTITGEVRSEDEKQRVAELAKRVNGVRDVANAVEVRSERVAY